MGLDSILSWGEAYKHRKKGVENEKMHDWEEKGVNTMESLGLDV